MYDNSIQCAPSSIGLVQREPLLTGLERQLQNAEGEVRRVKELMALLQENPKIERVLDLLQQRGF